MEVERIKRDNLIRVPRKYHKFLDFSYDFSLFDSIPTIELQLLDNDAYFIAKFFKGKSHTFPGILKSITFPLSIYVHLEYQHKTIKAIINKDKNLQLFTAGKHFNEAILSGNKVHKYLSLYKAYETLVDSSARDLDLFATRTSLSHSATHLTKKYVTERLEIMFGSLEIDLTKYKHEKVFYINFWKLMTAVDQLVVVETEKMLSNAKPLIYDIVIVE